MRDKNTSARLCGKYAGGGGGAYARGGGIFVGHYGTRHMHVHHVPHVEHAST